MVILTTLSNEIELMIPVNNLAMLINRFPISGIDFEFFAIGKFLSTIVKIMVILIMLVMVNVAINDADADFDNGNNYKFAIIHNNYRCFQGFLQTE